MPLTRPQAGIMGDSQLGIGAAYRQALRNITENYSSLENVVWPVKPV
jgi:hypothetical protein